MPHVQTVRGPIDTAEMGQTLMHEHVFVLSPDLLENYPEPWNEEERVADAVRKLQALAELGVGTIVDPTVVGLGRYVPRIQRIAERVPVHIIVATGLYTYRDLPFPLQMQGPGTLLDGPDPMVEMFVRDLTVGIAGTSVRAALLKCAIDEPGLTPGVERVLRAVAAAHHETGAPIMVHTHPGSRQGLVAQRVLGEQGVDLGRVQLAHSGDSTDLDYLRQLADAGSLLGMDRFGLDTVLATPARIDTVVALCEAGYAGQLVLSQDASCFIDWVPEQARALLPNWTYEHVHRDVLPALRERGVPEDQLDAMLVHNPRRYFESPAR